MPVTVPPDGTGTSVEAEGGELLPSQGTLA